MQNLFSASVSVPSGNVNQEPDAPVTVQAVMSRSFVNLPGWFPVAKAASVLRSLRREFVLIADSRGGVGVASLGDLSRAPDDKTALWCATDTAAFVTPLESVGEAWRKMLDMKTERLPVKVGDLIVGVVTSSTLRRVVRGTSSSVGPSSSLSSPPSAAPFAAMETVQSHTASTAPPQHRSTRRTLAA